jgi:peptidoglycan/LPS O-acetylase OafA/YrhL
MKWRVADHRENNFDTIRIVAAFSVIISHSFALEGNSSEPLFMLTDSQLSIGDLSVMTFFSISGYLVSKSFNRSSSAIEFVIARCLRILPALVTVLFISALLVAPFLSSVPLAQYFSDKQVYGYVIRNSLMSYRGVLPGVFEGLPYPEAVNGSLWTLAPEVQCYLVVLFLGLIGLLRGWIALILVVGFSIAAMHEPQTRVGLMDMFGCFAAGAAIYLWPIKLDWRIAAGWTLFIVIAIATKHLVGMASFAVAYIVIVLSLSPAIRMIRLAAWGDISYGLYIWAFFIQQIVALTLGTRGNWWLNILCAAPITIILAYASWHCIEQPSLSMKKRLSSNKAMLIRGSL